MGVEEAPHQCVPLPSVSLDSISYFWITVPIENIKELREGADARYYREQFQLAQRFEDRWLTIVYVLDGGYKTLHLIAATRDVFQMWDITLRRLYAVRQKLMNGLGETDVRQAVWEKHIWRSAAAEGAADQKLDFDEVERMCRRLNINPSREDLLRRFKVLPNLWVLCDRDTERQL